MSTYKGIQGTAVTNYAGDKPGVVDEKFGTIALQPHSNINIKM